MNLREHWRRKHRFGHRCSGRWVVLFGPDPTTHHKRLRLAVTYTNQNTRGMQDGGNGLVLIEVKSTERLLSGEQNWKPQTWHLAPRSNISFAGYEICFDKNIESVSADSVWKPNVAHIHLTSLAVTGFGKWNQTRSRTRANEIWAVKTITN